MGPLVPVHHPKVLGAEPRSEGHTRVAGPQGCPHLALSHQVETAGFTGSLGAPAHAELGEDVAHMGLHRRQLDAQKLADLSVALVLADETQHLASVLVRGSAGPEGDDMKLG